MAGRTGEGFSGSGAALIEFLDRSMQRGVIPPQTGATYIVACKDILSIVLGEAWTSADITTLDLAEMRHRLVALKGDRQLPRFDKSFLAAVQQFREHLGLASSPEPITTPMERPRKGSPASERAGQGAAKRKAPTTRRRTVLTPDPGAITSRSESSDHGTNGDGLTKPGKARVLRSRALPKTTLGKLPLEYDEREETTMNGSPSLPRLGVIPHLFPLRDGMLATLLLPADLTSSEAQRLTAFIASLAMPERSRVLVELGDPGANGSVATSGAPERELANSTNGS